MGNKEGKPSVELGDHVEDIVTGFSGIAVTRVESLDGSIDIGVRVKHKAAEAALPPIQYIPLVQLKKLDGGIRVKKAAKQIGFSN